VVLAVHPPALAALGLARGVGGWLLWGQVQEVIEGVVEAQTTIATAVEEQSAATAQAQESIVGASREATRVAADLQRIVDGFRAR
jgi:hypothetical protein